MISPHSNDPSSGYFLHVDLIVLAEDERAYEKAMAGFLGAPQLEDPRKPFVRLLPEADLELVLALKSEPFDYMSSGRGRIESSARGRTRRTGLGFKDSAYGQKVLRYVHVWTVPDLEDLDLAAVMLASSDDELYMAIDTHVLVETQEFVRRVARIHEPCLVQDTDRVHRILRRLPTAEVGKYLFYAGTRIPVIEAKGWGYWNQFQSVTGVLNTMVEFWTTREDKSLGELTALTDPEPDAGAGPKESNGLGQYELEERFTIPEYFRALMRTKKDAA